MSEHLGNAHNVLCPKCKTGDNLSIEIKVWATLVPDGSEIEGQDHEWDDFSRAVCKCGWEGKVVSLIQLPDGEGKMYECQDCETEWQENQLNPAKDLSERMSPGDVYTDVECPSCGALCYPI